MIKYIPFIFRCTLTGFLLPHGLLAFTKIGIIMNNFDVKTIVYSELTGRTVYTLVLTCYCTRLFRD